MSLFRKADPETLEVCGRPFRCVACQNETFHKRDAQLPSITDWVARFCVLAICSRCGYVHWFYPHDASGQ
jgi:predicted nucleic-acid-binding Zn-ribbon protein